MSAEYDSLINEMHIELLDIHQPNLKLFGRISGQIAAKIACFWPKNDPNKLETGAFLHTI